VLLSDSDGVLGTHRLAELTGARVLAEIGDDPTRFADARGPLRRQRRGHPGQRQVHGGAASAGQEPALASVGYVWAFAALTASPGARALRPSQERR